MDGGKVMRLFPPESQVTVRPCEHTVHTAKFKSSSEPPKEIAARRVAPADLAVQLELVVVHLQHEGGVFSLNGRWFLYRGTRGTLVLLSVRRSGASFRWRPGWLWARGWALSGVPFGFYCRPYLLTVDGWLLIGAAVENERYPGQSRPAGPKAPRPPSEGGTRL